MRPKVGEKKIMLIRKLKGHSLISILVIWIGIQNAIFFNLPWDC